ncbi:MAG: DUF4097 domain-containing protein [Lachnospiraceae bacterium]|nr:DUF4097 domain-containing protein [Lachnospiraceae bacterium]
MKRIINVLLICALILVVLGNLLYWGSKGYRYIRRDELNKNIGNKQFEIEQDILSVDITAQYADIEIQNAEQWGCYIENMDISKTEAYVTDRTLYVKAANRENMEVLGWNIGNSIDPGEKAKLIVYIPQDELRNFKIDVGTGSVSAGRINTSRFVVQIGAGSLSIDDLKVAGNGAIQIGGGSTCIKYLEAGEFSIKSGMGDIDVDLASTAQDYDIQATNTVGRIELLESRKTGLKLDILRRGDGFRQLKIDNGAGYITVH